MTEVVATAVVKEAVRGCFQAIGHHISFIRKYRVNINNLKVEVKKLEDARSTVSARVRAAENNAEDIFKNVLGWQKRCDELLVEANDLLFNEMSFHVSCLCCNGPNIKSRYSASREIAKLAPLITRHLEECMFDSVGQEPELGMLPLLSPGEFHGVGSRMEIMKEVMDDLQNDSIFIIGLCGMGGIGKTTLVKEIAEEVKKEKLFDEVAFVVVSHDKNVKAIQDQLASRLGLKSIANAIDINGRAELLYKRLMDEKKKILVILDDIWEELNLRSVGIPVHGDRDGFKILMTSRLHSVCTDMKVQKRLEIGILSDVEAWNLFNEIAEISDVSILQIAKEVALECAGLPLAIVTVAKSLRGKKEHAFRNVLRKLRDPSGSNSSRIHDVLYSCIKSSYDYLDSDDHRLLLLLCSLFPEDYDITMEDLVRYARGLFDTFETMAETRDRVEEIVDDLMKCYLLLQSHIRNCVKLHDVVRDVCISIASKSADVHISLNFDDLNNVLFGMKSQRLRLLRMVNEEYFWKSAYHSGGMKLENTLNRDMTISEEMQELRVLELNHITTRVPSSLQLMIKLQTLSLDYCRLAGDFAVFGSLKMLRVLSFFHSIVEVFPMEVAELTNLQCLDLRFKLEHPTTFPLRSLLNLKELEELYLGNIDSFDIGSLKEVSLSSKLNTIQFVVKDDESFEGLLRNLNLSKLIRFHIARDLEDGGEIKYQVRENVLELHKKNVHTDLELLKELMRRVEWFYLNGNGLINPVSVLGENGFQNLKELKLHDCDMEYLVDVTDHLAQCDFSELETLRIHNARKLEALIYGDLPVRTPIGNFNVSDPFKSLLGNLRRLEIFQCGKIKSLFSKSMVNCLEALEFIEIKFCPTFERIVRIQKVDEVDSSQGTEFPKLKHLTLNELPKFQSFGPGSNVGGGLNEVMLPKLEHLTIMLDETYREGVGEVCSYLGSSLPKVRSMDIIKCNNLSTIAKSGLVNGFQELQTLRVRVCRSVEVVFDFEEIMGQLSAETQVTTVLPRLEEIDLSYLTTLKHLWKMLPPPKGTPVFPNLKKIQVKGCNKMIHLLTPSVTKMLVHVEEIKLQDNNLMDTIIGIDEIDKPNDGEEILLERLILPKLKSLTIERLSSLRNLCSPQLSTLDLPSLNKLEITFMVQDIFTIDQISRLTSLSIGRIGHHIYSLTPSSAKLLPGIRELELYDDEQIEAILGSDEAGGDDTTKKSIALPELRKITIRNLPNFEKLCSSPDLNLELPSLTELQMINCPVDILTGEIYALQNLRKIKVEKCGKLYCLPSSSVQVLVNLEELVLRDNQSMYAIFEPQTKSYGYHWWDEIVLPQLRKLEISKLPNFRMFSYDNLDLPSLVQLCIEDCPKMSKLCDGQLSAPHLTNVIYGSTEITLETFIHSWLKESESMIRCLDCTYHGYDTCDHFVVQDRKAIANAKRPMHGGSNSDEATDEYLYTPPASLFSSAGTTHTSLVSPTPVSSSHPSFRNDSSMQSEYSTKFMQSSSHPSFRNDSSMQSEYSTKFMQSEYLPQQYLPQQFPQQYLPPQYLPQQYLPQAPLYRAPSGSYSKSKRWWSRITEPNYVLILLLYKLCHIYFSSYICFWSQCVSVSANGVSFDYYAHPNLFGISISLTISKFVLI